MNPKNGNHREHGGTELQILDLQPHLGYHEYHSLGEAVRLHKLAIYAVFSALSVVQVLFPG